MADHFVLVLVWLSLLSFDLGEIQAGLSSVWGGFQVAGKDRLA